MSRQKVYTLHLPKLASYKNILKKYSCLYKSITKVIFPMKCPSTANPVLMRLYLHDTLEKKARHPVNYHSKHSKNSYQRFE